MTQPIKLTLEANSPQELRKLLSQFVDALGGDSGRIEGIYQPSETKAEVTLADTAPTEKPAGADVDQPAPADDTGVVSDNTPAEARAEAIAVMQQHYAENPNCMPDIAKLQTKFGVKMFQDVTDDRAHELLADVLLIANGTPAGDA